MVVEYKIISYEYFLDRLQPYELTALLESIPYADRATWEQTRLRIFSTASMFSKREIKVQDIMRFAWDKHDEAQEAPSDKELQRLKSTAEKLIKTNVNRL